MKVFNKKITTILLVIVAVIGLVIVCMALKWAHNNNYGGKSMNVSFGDNVRIRVTKETEAAGVAGLTGQVYGETTPSATGVKVIGALSSDFAINVHFEERGESFWFASELVELLDHAPGSEIRLKGVDKKWIRTEDGSWKEESLRDNKKPEANQGK